MTPYSITLPLVLLFGGRGDGFEDDKRFLRARRLASSAAIADNESRQQSQEALVIAIEGRTRIRVNQKAIFE